MKTATLALVFGAVVALMLPAAQAGDAAQAARAQMKADFKSKGPATVDRVMNQDEAQRICSEHPSGLSGDAADKLAKSQMATIKLPSDGNYLGDWKAGEVVAQNGRGMQSSDAAGTPNGGNCYACHQITKSEISFGNIGPSLYNYGKTRGFTPDIFEYTWGKIYNAQAYTACSKMPRFGHNGILTEQQIRDVVALLLDPDSPVNN